MQGLDGDGLSAVGRAPLIVQPLVEYRYLFIILGYLKMCTMIYTAQQTKCARHTTRLSLPLQDLHRAHSIKETHTDGTSMNITLVTYSSEYVRCVALSGGEIEPNALQIFWKNASDIV